MGSIQLDLGITGETSSLLILTEASGRCLIGINMPKSSCEVVANFAKASAREFSHLSTFLT